ncbi:hypothetical protein DV735_g4341, partial [Chaetothyriales sp. CBS 134920]
MPVPPLAPSTKRRRVSSTPRPCWDDIPPPSSGSYSSDDAPSRVKRLRPLPEGYRCAICGKISRTESDFKKDQARHHRPHKCNVDGCPRVLEGFSTINDLNRHLKAVHRFSVEGAIDYICLVPGCLKPDKTWPRLDNFRQHVIRMHPDHDVDVVVQESRQWFQDNLARNKPSTPAPREEARVARPRAGLRGRRRRSAVATVTAGPEQSQQPGSFDPHSQPAYSGPSVYPEPSTYSDQSVYSVPSEYQFSVVPAESTFQLPELPGADPSDGYVGAPAGQEPAAAGWAHQQSELYQGQWWAASSYYF